MGPIGSCNSAGGERRIVVLWCVRDGTLIARPGWRSEGVGTVTSVAFHPNGELIAAGSDAITVRVWRVP